VDGLNWPKFHQKRRPKMWQHMMGEGIGYGMGWMLLWSGLVIWFVVFSILVLGKLDKIAQLLEKK